MGNLEWDGDTQFFFHYWRSERNSFGFFKQNGERIMILFCFDIILIKNNWI